MRFSRPQTRLQWAVLALMPSLLLLFLVSGIFRWSPFNSWHEEVDIHSGRIRFTRYLLYIRIDERTEDTWLSRLVAPLGPPMWHYVNTYSPGTGHSPHYRYHSAIAQIEMVETLNQIVHPDLAAKKEIANTILQAWQEGSDTTADAYLRRLSDVVISLHEQNIPNLSSDDLPKAIP